MENLLVKASAVASIVSYCKHGRRRDALCNSRSGDAEASATTPKLLPVRVRRAESQAGSLRILTGRPTGVSMKNFAFLALGSAPAPLLPCSPDFRGKKIRIRKTWLATM